MTSIVHLFLKEITLNFAKSSGMHLSGSAAALSSEVPCGHFVIRLGPGLLPVTRVVDGASVGRFSLIQVGLGCE